jgi:hypothetical protein
MIGARAFVSRQRIFETSKTRRGADGSNGASASMARRLSRIVPTEAKSPKADRAAVSREVLP